MTYSTKPELRKSLTGFLRQRIKAAQLMKQTNHDAKASWYALELTARRLLNKWELISTYGYWRHCLEVANHHRDYLAILPGKSSGHRHIRQHVIELIVYCCLMSTHPKEYTDAAHSN